MILKTLVNLSIFFLLVLYGCTYTVKYIGETKRTYINLYKTEYIDSLWYSNGNLKYVAQYKNDRLVGQKLNFYESGLLAEKLVCLNSDCSILVDSTWYNNGNLMEVVHYKDGKFDGERLTFYKSGNIEKKFLYRNGLQELKELWYYENGQLKMDIPVSRNQVHGEVKEYYSSGKIKSTKNWKRGKEEGLWTTYYESGNKEGEFYIENGQKNGSEKLWYENGKLKSEIIWDYGKPLDRTIYYDTGIKESEWIIIDPNLLQFNSYKEFYENGQIKFEQELVFLPETVKIDTIITSYDITKGMLVMPSDNGTITITIGNKSYKLSTKCWDKEGNIINCNNIDNFKEGVFTKFKILDK